MARQRGRRKSARSQREEQGAITPSSALPTTPRRSRRMAWMIGMGMALAVAALGLRSSPWLREWVLQGKDLPTLRQIVQRQPDDAMALYYLGKQAYREREYEEAENAFEAAARLKSDWPQARFNYGMALYRHGRTTLAEAQFERAIRLDRRLAGAEFMLGHLAWMRGDVTDGLAHAQRAVELDPQADRMWWILARFYLQVMRQDDAIGALRKALALREKSAEYHTALGEALIEGGKFEEARAHLERALELDANYGEACAALGSLYLNAIPGSDSLDKAETLLKRAAALETLSPPAVYSDLGQVYSEQGKYKLSADALRHAVHRGGDNEEIFYALAKACRKLGDTAGAAEAERQFRQRNGLRVEMPLLVKRVRSSPTDADAHLRLARGYRYIRQQLQAVHHYQAYLQLRKDDAQVSKELEEYSKTIRLQASKLLPETDTPELL